MWIWKLVKRLIEGPAQSSSSSSSSSTSCSSASKHKRLISDQFHSIEQVQQSLKDAGLESSNLIIGIDYTRSNVDQGRRTFGGRSLHYISNNNHDDTTPNPYQQVISIIGKTLAKFDDDQIIPAFGFGDSTTKDFGVFPINSDGMTNRWCYGFEEVLQAYTSITPLIQLSGPTNFAPLINRAIEIVQERGRKEYHILVIIGDGAVINVRETIQAIERASEYPLSIIMVGVGDGPWDTMRQFDDELPRRKFDNFQFVDFHNVIAQSESHDPQKMEAMFAVAALQEIPEQYREIRRLGLL